MCFDNNDINEETLSGSGTTHCTNGIAIQRQLECSYASSTIISNSKHRSKARTITVSASLIAEYSHKQCCGPGNMELNLSEITCTHIISAEKIDFAWFLA